MENQPEIINNSIPQTSVIPEYPPLPTPVQQINMKKTSPIGFITLITILIVSLGVIGFLYWQNQQLKAKIILLTKELSATKTTSVPAPTNIPTNICKNIDDLIIGYQKCGKDEKSYIIGPNSLRIDNVSAYTISPNKDWVFVVRLSDMYAKSGGAPSENALSMIDVKNAKAYELFSQIYFPTYRDPDSWSPSGKGIVFTAGESSTPDILKGSDMFSVVYCEMTCKVLAKNAGPEGIGGDAAYFKKGMVVYTGKNGGQLEVSLE